jgi:MBG domain (YGX type)
MTYGGSVPTLSGLSPSDPSVTFSGDWNGDTVGGVSGTISGCVTTATSASPVGPYPITGCTGFSVPGHDVSFVGGTLTIDKYKPHTVVEQPGRHHLRYRAIGVSGNPDLHRSNDNQRRSGVPHLLGQLPSRIDAGRREEHHLHLYALCVIAGAAELHRLHRSDHGCGLMLDKQSGHRHFTA